MQKPTPARLRVSPAVGSRGTQAAAPALRTAVSSRDIREEVEDIRDAVLRLKRERIIGAAVELFYSHGFGNTTLEAVAEKMNVTKPFIYSHFNSKRDLLAAICSHGIGAALDALHRVMASEGSPTEKMQALTREFMISVVENQAHIAIYTREQKHLSVEDRRAIVDMRREFDAKVCALLRAGVAAGEFVIDDVQLTSLAIGGIVSWSYVWYRPNGRLSAAETADGIADLVLAMLQAKPARRKRARATVSLEPA